MTALEPQVARYLASVVGVLDEILGEALAAVWLLGSAGAGAYEHGLSDLDVAVAVAGRPGLASKRQLAASLSHAALPCPARKLELVLYTRAVLAAPSDRLAFELNLNTGATEPDHVTYHIGDESPHWFLLDLAVGRDANLALVGPPLGDLLGPIPRDAIVVALRMSLDWFDANEPDRASVVLAACRAWRFAEEGIWSPKPEAAQWVAVRHGLAAVAERAVRLRRGEDVEPLREDEVETILALVRRWLR